MTDEPIGPKEEGQMADLLADQLARARRGEFAPERRGEVAAEAQESLAVEFIRDTAEMAGASDVLDFDWGIALQKMLARGWRVLPPGGEE